MVLYIILFILLIFIFINYYLNININNQKKIKKIKETFNSCDNNSCKFCNFFGMGSKYNSSGGNSNVYECGQEQTCSCARENEKCLVDPQGNNTCCNNLNCVRLKGEFGYKVCSTKQDACGYFRNDYLKYLFDNDAWEEIFNDVKNIFTVNTTYTETVEEENGEVEKILRNKRESILKFIKIKGICGQTLSANDIRKQLDDFFTNDQIFSGLIYGVEKVFNDLPGSNTTSGSNNRNCKYSNDTIDNY
jgi:hypothetical protein